MPSGNTLVTVQPADGSQVSSINCGPAGTFYPIAGTNQIQVPASFVPQLLANGWQIVVTGGTTHVP